MEAVVEADCDKIASSLYGNSRPTILYSSGFPLKTRTPFCRIPERRYPLRSMQVVEDVACTVCGCVCDDLRITVEHGRITQAQGACYLSQGWFLGQHSQSPPIAEIEGQPVPPKSPPDASGDSCQRSIPTGLRVIRSSTEGQRAAVRLAEQIGATIDTTASLCHAPSIMAIQAVGESTCTLGEVRHRADIVVFWRVNPVLSHPRHFERYSVDPVGSFVPRGRKDRTIVVVDEQPTETANWPTFLFLWKRDKTWRRSRRFVVSFEVCDPSRIFLRGLHLDRWMICPRA